MARGAEGAAIVEHDEGRWPAGARVRVKPGGAPGRWPRASTRPRWPVDAKNPFQNRECFFSTLSHAQQRPARSGTESARRKRFGVRGSRDCAQDDTQG